MTAREREVRSRLEEAVAEARNLDQEHAANGREFTTDEREAYSRVCANVAALNRELKSVQDEDAELQAGIAATSSETPSTPGSTNNSNTARGLLAQFDPQRIAAFRNQGTEYLSSFRAALLSERGGSYQGLITSPGGEPVNSTTATTGTSGGWLQAPMETTVGYLEASQREAPLFGLVNVIPITTLTGLGVPFVEDETTDDANWTPEAAVPSKDGIKASGRKLTPHLISKESLIAYPMLQFSPYPAEQIVLSRLRRKHLRAKRKAIFTGNGNQQPLGTFVNSADGLPAATCDVTWNQSTAALKYEGLVRAVVGLNATHRNSPKTAWMFGVEGLVKVMLLQDPAGNYIFRFNAREGAPPLLLNLPYHDDEFCPDTYSNDAYVGVLGNWEYYYWLQLLQLLIQTHDLEVRSNLKGYIGREWCDGAPVLAEAFRRLKVAGL